MGETHPRLSSHRRYRATTEYARFCIRSWMFDSRQVKDRRAQIHDCTEGLQNTSVLFLLGEAGVVNNFTS